MSENSKIEWTHHTFNPWIGCAKVSPGCAHCYAETLMDTRYGRVKWGKGQPRQRTSAANWKKPRQWNKAAEGANERPRVFCASLADWLDDEVPIDWLADLMRLICETPNLDWLLLTKRPENFASRMRKAYMEACCGSLEADNMMGEWEDGTPPPNVWVGTTVENQEMADRRIQQLLSIPAKVRFLSCEPLLGPVDIVSAGALGCDCPDQEQPDGTVEARCSGRCAFYRHAIDKMKRIDWVICGGESGPKARPMHPDWARSLRDQCQAAGVPFFMKQMGGVRKPFSPIPDDLNIRQFPTP